ncbi:MAG TPA: hypothetical protein DC058_03835 [Planctomycetaceae bacterium]|nr:hypothetical protein [Planctomycetaceae bacterium]HBC60334.1 hypothetical protein [Planctomycetaceae bacterium]
MPIQTPAEIAHTSQSGLQSVQHLFYLQAAAINRLFTGIPNDQHVRLHFDDPVTQHVSAQDCILGLFSCDHRNMFRDDIEVPAGRQGSEWP